MTKRFAIIGVAGYIAPRHLEAIKACGGELVAAMDKNDSVGILDKYFPEAAFFTEFERFERHLEKLKQNGKGIDYLVVCTPNYLHDSHCRFGLKLGADVICEKPLVLNPHNLEGLKILEKETGKQIFCILQLRLHPDLIQLKHQIENTPEEQYQVELNYITPRGRWYDYSWKGDESKSGGIVTNIGIHLFDILCWLFGEPLDLKVIHNNERKISGKLTFRNSNVQWFLSIDKNDLPKNQEQSYRSFIINEKNIPLDNRFNDMHINSYKEIMNGKGFGTDSAAAAIRLTSEIRRKY
jgi:UDP-N-acetyl-2-amino-2-deoxyglucuronate dehydrogenase